MIPLVIKMRQSNFFEAYLDDFHRIIAYMGMQYFQGESSFFYLRDSLGDCIELEIEAKAQSEQGFMKYTLHFDNDLKIGEEYEIFNEHAKGIVLQYSGIVKTKLFDELYFYEHDDLGYMYTPTLTKFACWAPTASRVQLDIYKDNRHQLFEMQRGPHGVFRYEIHCDLENTTYVYQIRANGVWKATCDPYAFSSIENSKRSAIIDLNKCKSKTYSLPELKTPCDAVIYETSVRDFTIDLPIKHPGKFLGFIEENAQTKANDLGFSYLKKLGVTHIQLLPVFDFGSVDELHVSRHYNWGYDPVHYRCLEGSYSSDPTDPYARVQEMIKLVEICHKHQLRVNLDVVFNHVYDVYSNPLDCCVPNYYFQMNADGYFSNGTYCGNDIDSLRAMSAKYIIDTCVLYVTLFDIDGLRFDLMGILDIDVMNRIVTACRSIKPDFMVYGEGWDMQSFLTNEKKASMFNQAKMPEIAHFSDRFRDTIKGNTSPYALLERGYCSGETSLLDRMKNCLCASVGWDAVFNEPQQAINYVECHDNMTCWDKICSSTPDAIENEHIAIHKMMLAATLLAQGIPFIHCGQEFARSKNNLADTYNQSDAINHIDYQRRDKYQMIVDAFKDLLAIRRRFAPLRLPTTKAIKENVSFESIEDIALLYRVHDTVDELCIFFNPSHNSYTYQLNALYNLLYRNQACALETVNTIEIPPFTTIILHRKRT